MWTIAIADDDSQDAAALRGCVSRFFEASGEAYVIREYSSGEELIRSPDEYDVIFLDIRMGGIDGVETARFLRKISQDAVLIFVTNMAQFAIHGYEVDAMDFILKPIDQPAIDRVLTKVMKRIQGRTGVQLTLKTPAGATRISSNSVHYVEVYNHELVYHTETGDVRVRGQLSEVRERLENQHFILCNRSYLVNLRYISSLSENHLVVGDDAIPISKSRRREIEQRFVDYLGENT